MSKKEFKEKYALARYLVSATHDYHRQKTKDTAIANEAWRVVHETVKDMGEAVFNAVFCHPTPIYNIKYSRWAIKKNSQYFPVRHIKLKILPTLQIHKPRKVA